MTAVEVHVEDRGELAFAGTAYFTRTRGRVSTTFTYAPTYLARPDAQSIDPQLALVSGAQHTQGLFGSFADASPDRWGRNLVTRLERENARAEERLPRSLDDVDFLLGVSAATRQGALRFRRPGTDTFLGPPAEVPRTIALPTLLRASDAASGDVRDIGAVKTLLDAGTGSLGGARPKAAVMLDDGGLGIAKFPHGSDEWDVMAWEATALDVAQSAGIIAPDHRLVRVDDRHVLLLRRFDRVGERRIGFVSAMTMLDAADGDDHDYVDLAERLTEVSAAARHDRSELFDRVALSVALGNTDDHLRNHGFLVARGGWRLSPVFDVNVNPDLAAPRRTSIAGAAGVADEPDGLLELASACGLAPEDARLRIANVIGAASGWRQAALANRITERELTLMADALEPRINALRRLAR